jgi:uncharacterized iron-regulated protein
MVVLLLAAACAAPQRTKPSLATIDGISGQFPAGHILHMATGKSLSFDQLVDQLASKDLVFIGEVHTNPEHHLIQVQVLQALMERNGPLTVAMEFFPVPRQPVLDQYMNRSLTETDFLKAIEWRRTWGFSYQLYRPLLLTIRSGKGRVLAINAPRRIVRKVARSGLSSLKPAERKQIASTIDLGNAEHRRYIRSAYEMHAHHGLSNFEFFYQAQCVWEDTMAENIAAHLKRAGGKVVVLAGNGHLVRKFGIPNRTRARVSVTTATLLPYPLPGPLKLGRDMGDFVWLTGDCKVRRRAMPPGPIRKAEKPSAHGIRGRTPSIP